MGTELLDQEFAELRMMAIAKNFPDIRVTQSGEGGYFEFEEVVLCGVEVDRVDTTGLVDAEGEDVITCRGDG